MNQILTIGVITFLLGLNHCSAFPTGDDSNSTDCSFDLYSNCSIDASHVYRIHDNLSVLECQAKCHKTEGVCGFAVYEKETRKCNLMVATLPFHLGNCNVTGGPAFCSDQQMNSTCNEAYLETECSITSQTSFFKSNLRDADECKAACSGLQSRSCKYAVFDKETNMCRFYEDFQPKCKKLLLAHDEPIPDCPQLQGLDDSFTTASLPPDTGVDETTIVSTEPEASSSGVALTTDALTSDEVPDSTTEVQESTSTETLAPSSATSTIKDDQAHTATDVTTETSTSDVSSITEPLTTTDAGTNVSTSIAASGNCSYWWIFQPIIAFLVVLNQNNISHPHSSLPPSQNLTLFTIDA